MNVLIISRCTKRAREESCRILDQFAERTGDAAWQTLITLEGLNTLRKLLRKTARRNTAVACHWLKKNGQTELLWIVGNLRRFNAQGRVPTNRTRQTFSTNHYEHAWRSAESIALLAAIAGLFHDFGKANHSFQQTLAGTSKRSFQPYRHEWISLRLFQAFVGTQTDVQWLASLEDLSVAYEATLLTKLKTDNLDYSDSPFKALPPLAKTVAWLILSHHRLPQPGASTKLSLEYSEGWMDRQLNADWNSLNHNVIEWGSKDFTSVWSFPKGTPLRSKTWCEKARQIGKRARNAASLNDHGSMGNLFTQHLARMTLMLADHFYSSQLPYSGWQDPRFKVWANTDKSTHGLKQKLDEHNVGVAHHALLLGRSLPSLRRTLPAIARHKVFRERARDSHFLWQNKAWDEAVALREPSKEHGFFGINMASTGCGKTFANARIMYALADENEGCRFTIALGLRTLTLQTGRSLQSRLMLDDDDIAVLTGSPAVSELQSESHKRQNDNSSASEEAFFASHQYVHYEGSIANGAVKEWLTRDNKLNRLVSSPILVTTIDHLMPATEGIRGGKQIPSMLRLLTSDLVLDEPDDFDVADLPAMCRLVNWAGMLGARVLLSSATLPPALTEALFSAYKAGRDAWLLACSEPGRSSTICCAWFDEYRSSSMNIEDSTAFQRAHRHFADARAAKLPTQPAIRQGKMAIVEPVTKSVSDVIGSLAVEIHHQMLTLHDQHHETHSSGKTVSLGLVRIANINPLVAVAQRLMAIPADPAYCIHYCVYHSRHPLAVRSFIEKRLDAAFTRHKSDLIWQLPEVQDALNTSSAQHHLFVVLATSVVEVGRDWDADWGIIEPSSMRSIIQFAGRIQRHRQYIPVAENIIILNQNIKALRGQHPAYCKPGFETSSQPFSSADLRALLPQASYRIINAIPRITDNQTENVFAALEHARLQAELSGTGHKNEKVAAQWWRAPVTWHGELQRLMPFRQRKPERQFFITMIDEDDEPYFAIQDERGRLKATDGFEIQQCHFVSGAQPWFAVDYRDVLLQLADERQMELCTVALRYGEIVLQSGSDGAVDDWRYHPLLGVFREYL